MEIHRRRFDAVVDLERIIHIGRSEQGLADGSGALADGERGPVFLFRLLHKAVEFFLAFKNDAHRQAGLEFRDRAGLRGERAKAGTNEEKKKSESQHGLHDWRRREDVKRESFQNGFGCGRRG